MPTLNTHAPTSTPRPTTWTSPTSSYIRRKTRELRETRALLQPSSGLNHREIALLRHALQHPDTVFTDRSHQMSHGVVYQTARTDLLELARRDHLIADLDARKHAFRVSSNVAERVHEAGA